MIEKCLKKDKSTEEKQNNSSIIMAYQKRINLLDNTPFKFKNKNCMEVNEDSYVRYSANTQIEFETSIMRSKLCHYSEAYILVKGTTKIRNTGTDIAPNNRNQRVISKICTPFTHYTSKINNTEVKRH